MKAKDNLIILAMIAFLSSCMPATYLTLPSDQHSVVKVNEVDMNRLVLYTTIQQWFSLNLGKSKEALQIQDKEAGLLMGRMIVPNGLKDALGVRHDLQMDIKVEVKDGKYRITMENFTFYYQGPGRLVSPGSEHASSLETANRIASEINSYVVSAKANKDF